VVVSFLLSLTGVAMARPVRPLFEPTDLELELPGVLDVDLQLGVIRGAAPGPYRVVTPDFEVDLGLLNWLELDIDGTYAVDENAHAVPDNLWISAKIALAVSRSMQDHHAWGVGVQIGPKVPVAPGSTGVGVEGLALFGGIVGPVQAVINAGGFIDPAPDEGGRDKGFEAGLDLEIHLTGPWFFVGELSGVSFTSNDPDQLLSTAGIKWSPRDSLDLSLVGLLGYLDGSDRFGILFGISPKFRLL
jgi:hypothetical protein